MDLNSVRIKCGFLFSLIMVMLSAWTKSFNVISVDMKDTFNFTMTEIQILASSTMGGWLFNFLAVYLVDGSHIRICYVVAILMVTSSAIILIMAVNFVDFFKNQLVILSIAWFTGAGGYVMAYLPSFTWSLHNTSKHHAGKLIAVYLSVRTMGRVYFSAVFDVWFARDSNLNGYFVIQMVVFLVVGLGCVVSHTKQKLEPESPTDLDELVDKKSEDLAKTETIPKKELIVSIFFQSIAISGSIFCSISNAFVNNVANIAKAVRLVNPQSAIYVVSTGLLIGRITWGFMLDRTHTTLSAIGLTLISYIIYTLGNAIGFFRLNDVTMFIISTLIGLGSGPSVSMAIGILNKTYGIKSFPFISAYVNLLICFFTIVIQMAMGLAYDWSNVHQISFCLECFFGSFLILMISIAVCFIIQVINLAHMYLVKRQKC